MSVFENDISTAGVNRLSRKNRKPSGGGGPSKLLNSDSSVVETPVRPEPLPSDISKTDVGQQKANFDVDVSIKIAKTLSQRGGKGILRF